MPGGTDPAGRWDCLDYLRLQNGTIYGYFTANPRGDAINYQPCGFGMAESRDGVHWTALPPAPGNIGGEIGGVQRIGNKYYASVGGGQIGVADSPRGPFLTQKKNPNAFGGQCDVGFPRFFHNPPVETTLNRNGALMSHFFWGSWVYSSLLKAIEIDAEGTFRIKWWEPNNRLKQARKRLAVGQREQANLRRIEERFNLESVGLVEATFSLTTDEPEQSPRGFLFEQSGNLGYVLLFNRTETVYGLMDPHGTVSAIFARVTHDLDYGPQGNVRLVFKHDLLEAYVNDYLVMVKRVYWNGKLGVVGPEGAAKGFQAWTRR